MAAISSLPKELRLLEQTKRLLAEASSIDEIKDIRDKAEALRLYARQVDESRELENAYAEIKLEAERKAGKLIAASGIGRGKKSDTLSDLGISHHESSRWQRIASVPEKDFRKYISDTKKACKEITSAAVLRLGRAAQNCSEIVHGEPIEGVVSCLSELSGKKFGTIYADPPWAYGNTATRANVEGLYAGTMTVDEICEMPVDEYAAEDAHLHLWTTNGFLREAFSVIDAWGFEYKSCAVWCKPQMGIGNYWRVSHEFLLLGIRGDTKRFSEHSHRSWQEIDRTKEHSTKPDEFRGIIERVSPGPFLELFGRKPIDGWMVFGNQVEQRLFSA